MRFQSKLDQSVPRAHKFHIPNFVEICSAVQTAQVKILTFGIITIPPSPNIGW